MIENPTDEDFTVRHRHPARRELVFACLTTAEHLTHFWGPAGTHTPAESIVADLRPGGRFETTMVDDATGETHTMRAHYVAVDAPAFVSWREIDSGVLTELEFIDLGDGTTEVVTTQRGLPPQMRTPQARTGWASALDKASTYIAALGDRRGPNHQGESMTSEDHAVQAGIGRELSALADALEGVPTRADEPSLCAGWTVRHVLAHMTMPARYDAAAYEAELRAAGYDFGRLSETVARRDAELPYERLLDDLRSDTLARWAPPGGGAMGALTHTVIHGLDMTTALDLARASTDEACVLVLDLLVATDPFGVDASGYELRVGDLPWRHGSGPVIEASAGDLILALSGRARPGIELTRSPVS